MANIPRPITINTDEQGQVIPIIDRFFQETMHDLESRCQLQKDPSNFEIKTGELAYQNGQVTDDRITYLNFRDKVIAIVTEIRTPLNHIQYSFFRLDNP